MAGPLLCWDGMQRPQVVGSLQAGRRSPAIRPRPFRASGRPSDETLAGRAEADQGPGPHGLSKVAPDVDEPGALGGFPPLGRGAEWRRGASAHSGHRSETQWTLPAILWIPSRLLLSLPLCLRCHPPLGTEPGARAGGSIGAWSFRGPWGGPSPRGRGLKPGVVHPQGGGVNLIWKKGLCRCDQT